MVLRQHPTPYFNAPSIYICGGRSPLKLDQQTILISDFQSILSRFLHELPGFGKARNMFCFDKEDQNPAQIVAWSISLVIKFYSKEGKRKRRVPGDNSATQWKSPPRGNLKLNSDAGVFSDGSVGLGFIVRNEAGELVLAGAKRCWVAADNSTTIEALELHFGLLSVCSRGLHVDLIESDSLSLVHALVEHSKTDAVSALIIGDVDGLLADLGVHDILFARRGTNRAVHYLAHFSPVLNFEKLWDMEVPPECNCFIVNDVRREPLNLG
ncbi:hypothetical protein ACS0TY_013287 [Phlomoides rotata]